MTGLNKIMLFFICFATLIEIKGQVRFDSSKIISGVIYMDSSIVVAAKRGFDIDDFIQLVKKDTSFYKAFQNLRFLNYDFENEVRATFFQSRVVGSYRSHCHQFYKDRCRTMQCKDIQVSEDYYKKGEPSYFTGQLYERLFLTKEQVCNQKRTSVNVQKSKKHDRPLSNPVEQIKIIMFNPGQRSSLPIIGRKMDIFNPRMSKYYQFSIQSQKYKGNPCYVFSTQVKPEFVFNKRKKTVLKKLKTYFHKKDFQIIYREYTLEYQSALVKFKIDMKVNLDQFVNQYYPTQIQFKGYWDVPTKKAEQAQFKLNINNVTE